MSEDWHGTIAGYNHHRCRCYKCRQSMSEYKKTYRAGRGGEVDRIYRQTKRSRNREAENARRGELRLRKLHQEHPVTTMPFYQFLAEQGHTF